MTDRKADFDALVQETMTFVKSNRVEPHAPHAVITPPVPRTFIEPSRIPPVSVPKSERDQIRERVSNFKAHQERVTREREEYAASQLKRMLERTPPADRNG
jgi:hypothetical protein